MDLCGAHLEFVGLVAVDGVHPGWHLLAMHMPEECVELLQADDLLVIQAHPAEGKMRKLWF